MSDNSNFFQTPFIFDLQDGSPTIEIHSKEDAIKWLESERERVQIGIIYALNNSLEDFKKNNEGLKEECNKISEYIDKKIKPIINSYDDAIRHFKDGNVIAESDFKTIIKDNYLNCKMVPGDNNSIVKNKFNKITNASFPVLRQLGFIIGYLGYEKFEDIDNLKLVDEIEKYRQIGLEYRAQRLEKKEQILVDNEIDKIKRYAITVFEQEKQSAIEELNSNKKSISEEENFNEIKKDWYDVAKEYDKKKMLSLLISILILGVYGVWMCFTFIQYDEFIKDLGTQGKIIFTTISVVLTGAVLIFFKLLANSYSMSEQLANDASQRVAIFESYIKLVASGEGSDAIRELMLKEVLSKSGDQGRCEIVHPIERLLEGQNLNKIEKLIKSINHKPL